MATRIPARRVDMKRVNEVTLLPSRRARAVVDAFDVVSVAGERPSRAPPRQRSCSRRGGAYGRQTRWCTCPGREQVDFHQDARLFDLGRTWVLGMVAGASCVLPTTSGLVSRPVVMADTLLAAACLSGGASLMFPSPRLSTHPSRVILRHCRGTRFEARELRGGP